jgi:DNA-directed RNA polymerase specialized sigma24 family protein
MDEKQFELISKKLDAIILLLALDKEKLNEKNKSDSIVYLHEFGLDNSTIALITGSTPQTVSVRLSEARKKKKK